MFCAAIALLTAIAAFGVSLQARAAGYQLIFTHPSFPEMRGSFEIDDSLLGPANANGFVPFSQFSRFQIFVVSAGFNLPGDSVQVSYGAGGLKLDASGQPLGFRAEGLVSTTIYDVDSGDGSKPQTRLKLTISTDGSPVGRWDYRNYYSSSVGTITNGRYQFSRYPIPNMVASPKNLGVCQAGVGNPVNPATGNKAQLETDFLGAPHTMLELRRFYNSQDIGSVGFGANWRGFYDRSLTQPNATAVEAKRADARVDTFTKSGTGTWLPDPDVTSVLSPIMNGANQTGWTLRLSDDSVETYDLSGKLLSIRTREGLVATLAYNASNRLTSVTGPFGHALAFAYDSSFRVSQATAPDSGIYSYAYDARSNLTSVTYPDGKVRSYVYENAAFPNLLTGIIDENGVRFATYAYDAQGRAISTQHAGGAERTTLVYKTGGSASVTDARGATRDYTFRTQFDLAKLSALTGAPAPGLDGKAFSFNTNGFLSRRTDYNGNITTYRRNPRGLETSRTEASGTGQARTITTAWHASLRLPTKTTEPGRTTTFTYDAAGNLTKRTIAAGGKSRSWSFTYNGLGQVLTIDGPRTNASDITSFTYDGQGNLASTTDAFGRITRFPLYDPNGRPLRIEDPNGLATVLAYDPRGRLISRTVGGEVTTYAYDGVGQLVRLTRPDGSLLAYSYDNAQRLTEIRDGSANRLVYTRDAAGNVTREEVLDAGGAVRWTRSYTYDVAQRLSSEIGASGQTTAYTHDPNGNLTRTTDPIAHVTANAYDPLDRVVSTTDPDGGVTGFSHDANDRLTGVTDPLGLTTAYGYDGLDNRLSTQSPDSGATARTYDTAGNVVTETDARGVKTTYAYDALNRPTKASFSDGTAAIVYRYDEGTSGMGRLTSMTDPSGTTSWTYDQHGRVIQKAQLVAGKTLTTGYSYDAAGRLAGMVYPSGKTLAYGYDALGRVSGITVNGQPLLSGAVYRPFGPVEGWSAGNGGAYSRAYDNDGGVASIAGQAGANTRSSVFTYDAARRITAISDSALPVTSFDYDALDRLTGFLRGTASQGFTYDANGNRLSLAAGTATTNYQYATGSNRLQGRSGAVTTAYTYDAAGNLTGDGARTYTYDGRGRMVKVVKGAATNQYLLNGLGQRVSKSGSGVTSGRNTFVYDEAGHLIGEYNASGALLKETVWLGDMPVGVLLPSAINYAYPDHLGAPWTIANQSGATIWTWNRDPFGTTAPTGSFTYNFRFPGQYFDKETGLSYNYYRDYDPTTGRYVQSDPIGLKGGGLSTYAYVRGNPLSYIDPSGLAYFASRALEGLPWLGPISQNPLDDLFNTEISHEQLFFEDSKTPSNIGFFNDGTLKEELTPSGYHKKSGHYDDCIMRKAVANTSALPRYCLIGSNCQDWADRVRKEYKRLEGDQDLQKECGRCQ